MDYKFYESLLSEQMKMVYSKILSSLREQKDSFKINATATEIDHVIKYIMLDNPELFWFEGKWEAEAVSTGIRIHPKYKRSAYNYSVLQVKIREVLMDVIRAQEDNIIMSIRKIYDWLLDNVTYGKSVNDQTVEGVIIDRIAVCKGIAKTFQFCMNLMEVPSLLVEGTIDEHESHVWNMVLLNDKAYHVDVTMGYPQFSLLFNGKKRNLRYPCFMISDETIRLTHRIYFTDLPRCSTSFDIENAIIAANIPIFYSAYGKISYLGKGATSDVFMLNGESGTYVLKVIDFRNSEPNYYMARNEIAILTTLEGCKRVMPLVKCDIDNNQQKAKLLFPYFKTLTVRRNECSFDCIHDSIRLGIDIIQALIECKERGVLYLDLQPKNIYYDNRDLAILGDFGNASFICNLDKLNFKYGTLAFIAPEVYYDGVFSEASTLYSLGIILYSIINDAKLPFWNYNINSDIISMRLSGANIQIPSTGVSSLWLCIKKMCAYNVNDRYLSYEDAMESLISCM